MSVMLNSVEDFSNKKILVISILLKSKMPKCNIYLLARRQEFLKLARTYESLS